MAWVISIMERFFLCREKGNITAYLTNVAAIIHIWYENQVMNFAFNITNHGWVFSLKNVRRFQQICFSCRNITSKSHVEYLRNEDLNLNIESVKNAMQCRLHAELIKKIESSLRDFFSGRRQVRRKIV